MARRGPVIDTDAHFLEPMDELKRYFDDPWRTRLERGGEYTKAFFLPGDSGDRGVGGRIQRSDTAYQQSYGAEEAMTTDDLPTAMRKLGIDKTIMISHLMLAYPLMKADDTRAIELAKGSTRFMLDQVTDAAEGIYTLLPMPFHDPDAALDVFDEFKDEDEVVGICMITAGAEPPLGNRKYEPIYDAAEDQGLPVVFHTGGAGLDQYHSMGYEKFIETHVLGFLEGNMGQLVSLIVQAIPEKFPDMEIVFQESGVLWVSSIMHRLDAEYLKRQSEAPLLEKPPSEYIKDMYIGTQPMEKPDDLEFFEKAIEVVGGPERLMYASDYPHWDYDRPSIIESIPFLSEEEKEMILSTNAQEVFGI